MLSAVWKRAVVILSVLAACSSSSPNAPTTIGVVGYLNLVDPDISWAVDQPCEGSGGYSDLKVGAPVTVKDEGGDTIATGAVVRSKAGAETVCSLVLLVEDVPISKFYSVEVSHRGESTHPHSEVEDGFLNLALTIGS